MLQIKKILLMCAAVICVSSKAQKKSNSNQEPGPISYVTHGKDTLFLLNDDVGKMIASTWTGNLYVPERDGKKPHIVFVSYKYIQKRYSVKTQPVQRASVGTKKISK